MPHIAVVVPVYQAAPCLAELYRRTVAALEPLTSDFQLIWVDDASTDASWVMIQDLAAADSRLRGIRLTRNFGQHQAIAAGLDQCDADWVVVMDCDLQHRPEDIPALYARALTGFDIVIAAREHRHDSPGRRIATLLFYKAFRFLSGLPDQSALLNFRILSRRVVDSSRLLRERARFLGGVIAWVGYPSDIMPLSVDSRLAGRSSYRWGSLVRLATEITLAYSDRPLRLAAGGGLLMAAAALLFGAYVFSRAIFVGIPVTGWASLMVSIFFLGGMNVGVVGILGLYVARDFEQSKGRPVYLIRDSTVDPEAFPLPHHSFGAPRVG
ncbi:MAG: glycosyltransferase family 2 protein [Minisyncoccota bacterium]